MDLEATSPGRASSSSSASSVVHSSSQERDQAKNNELTPPKSGDEKDNNLRESGSGSDLAFIRWRPAGRGRQTGGGGRCGRSDLLAPTLSDRLGSWREHSWFIRSSSLSRLSVDVF